MALDLPLLWQWAQYFAYDLWNWRVLKKLATIRERFDKCKSRNPDTPTQDLLRSSYGCAPDAFKSKILINRYKNDDYLLSLIWNPNYVSFWDYEQDKVIELWDIVDNASIQEFIQVINLFIDNVFECWKYWFSDRIWEFRVNNWMNNDGNVILLDFSEITFSKDHIKENILSEYRMTQRSPTTLDDDKKNIYTKIMLERVTLENLDKYRNLHNRK